MDIIYQYPPELTQLLIDTIPLLCRTKNDVLLFFRGTGFSTETYARMQSKLAFDRKSINKYEMARQLVAEMNERGEPTLRERRELLKRVTEFENFTSCWPDDQWKAKGLVSEIRSLVNVKDSFTRMKQEAQKASEEKRRAYADRIKKEQARNTEIDSIRTDLASLFSETNPQKRGKQLESVLNRLFSVYGVAIREAFTITEVGVQGITDQIDGAIEIAGDTYLVEMKWTSDPVGKGLISQHLVRVYHRGFARGIFVSTSPYTDPALHVVKEVLQRTVFVLVNLDEIVLLLEHRRDLQDFLREKISAAVVDKNPLKRIP